MTIRVSRGSLSFTIASADAEEQVAFTPYTIKSGMSMAANLREAFKGDASLYASGRARLLVDTPVLMLPIEEYDEQQNEALYLHAFPETEGAAVVANVLPDLKAVALFAVNKDLRTVVQDHFQDVKCTTLMLPVWRYLHQRSSIGIRLKLFANIQDDTQELFSFERNRFVFANRFPVKHAQDAVYFTLFVWKELALDQLKDELYLSGHIKDRDGLLPDLQQHVKKVTVINPSADFNRAPMTAIKGITFDLLTLYLG